MVKKFFSTGNGMNLLPWVVLVGFTLIVLADTAHIIYLMVQGK